MITAYNKTDWSMSIKPVVWHQPHNNTYTRMECLNLYWKIYYMPHWKFFKPTNGKISVQAYVCLWKLSFINLSWKGDLICVLITSTNMESIMNQFWGMYCNIAFHKALLEQELFINNLYSFNKRWVCGKEKGGGVTTFPTVSTPYKGCSVAVLFLSLWPMCWWRWAW